MLVDCAITVIDKDFYNLWATSPVGAATIDEIIEFKVTLARLSESIIDEARELDFRVCSLDVEETNSTSLEVRVTLPEDIESSPSSVEFFERADELRDYITERVYNLLENAT